MIKNRNITTTTILPVLLIAMCLGCFAAYSTTAANRGDTGRTIVGLWRVHYYEGGQEVFQSFDQWHRDGLEFEVSNIFGLSCQGTWIHKGPGTVQLFHTGYNFDANGQLTGYFNEVQTVTVSVDGQTYEGTWDIKNYDVDGNFVSEQSGTLNADRLTVQTPL